MKSSLPQKKIFISYRVHDTAGETGRLVDSLRNHFTDDQLFLDIDNLEPGADFTEVIEKSLDTCDVFLAVIGPYWQGTREGSNKPRIQEPGDWVRLEVSTALRRNIRVVPVLVDGGTLPKAEELPEDLQGLLRRQAIEISNKRWRYDTDQLIDFLINKIGIPPKKQAMTATAVQAPPRKRKTWLYVAGGFVLCFVVLVVIGSLMNEEKKAANPNNATENTAENKLQAETTPTQTEAVTSGGTAAETSTSITGTWLEDDEGEKSAFVLRQSGSMVDVVVQAMGQNIATGSGEIRGRDVVLNMPLFGVPTVVHLTLSADGRKMTGTYTMQANGVAESIRLTRQGD